MRRLLLLTLCAGITSAVSLAAADSPSPAPQRSADGDAFDRAIVAYSADLVRNGRRVFRTDTFGDEVFWGDTLQLHRAIAGAANGGVGPGVSPHTALAVGLKVDRDALPAALKAQLRQGRVDLTSPATTLALLRLDAVVGVKGFFDRSGQLRSVGIQCALCHSTVDDSFAPGIGERLDGWPNRDLNVGAIIALAPNLSPFTNALGVDDATVRAVLHSWGPGKFDAELMFDGKAFRPDGGAAATLLPAAFGLAGVNLHTYTGWGSVPHWNALVATLEMGGQGTFYDPRLADAEKFPVAARLHSYDVRHDPDLVTSKLPALQVYQLSIPTPTPPPGSYNASAAKRGQALFAGKAQCATCHVPPLYTDAGWNMHTPAEIGIDDFQSSRSPDEHYRTTPLRGLFARQRGGFYHDGRFPTYLAVVEHYDAQQHLGLSAGEKSDLVEFLKSL
jgi:mono/diheme cytochrome c family protein